MGLEREINYPLETKYDGNDYIIVEYDEQFKGELIEEVNNLMTIGYRPLGGLSIRVGSCSGSILMQAMLRTRVAGGYKS